MKSDIRIKRISIIVITIIAIAGFLVEVLKYSSDQEEKRIQHRKDSLDSSNYEKIHNPNP